MQHGSTAGPAWALAFLLSCGGRTAGEDWQVAARVPEAPPAKPPESRPPPKADPPVPGPPPIAPPVPVPLPPMGDPNALPVPFCAGDEAFGKPSPVPGLDTNWSIEGAWLSEDGRELILGARPGGADTSAFDLYVTRRLSADLPFQALEPLPELNSEALERRPVLTANGLIILFESARSGQSSDIYVAERAMVGGKFDNVRLVEDLSTMRNDVPGAISPVNQTLYYNADRLGGPGQENLYDATRAQDGSFVDRNLIASVDSDGSNIAPAISSDELTIYFSSNRDNPDLSYDVFRARRPAIDKFFNVPVRVDELSAQGSELVAWVSFDECRLLLTREIVPGFGHFELLSAER